MPHTCNNCKSHVRIIYRCRVCDDFNLCISCKRKDGHLHPMEICGKLETSQRCVQLMMHVSQCRDTNCRLASCQKMKQVMHTKKLRPIPPIAGVVYFLCCSRCVVVSRNTRSILVHHQDCSLQLKAATITTGATAQEANADTAAATSATVAAAAAAAASGSTDGNGCSNAAATRRDQTGWASQSADKKYAEACSSTVDADSQEPIYARLTEPNTQNIQEQSTVVAEIL